MSQKIRQIDEKTKFIIYGFIRRSFEKDIPSSIIYICLSYLWCIESFARCTFDLEIFNGNYSVQKCVSNNCWNNICYGTIGINSMSNKLVIWTFEIDKYCELNKQFYTFMLYLISQPTLMIQPHRNPNNYKLNVNHAWILSQRNTKSTKKIRTIKVILNTFGQTICLAVGGHTHCVCNDLVRDNNIDYRVAVSILKTDQKVTLINFQCNETDEY